jgi:hypothetical protein
MLLSREAAELADELRAAAAKSYELGRMSQEVAAQIAGVSRSEFLAVLSNSSVSPRAGEYRGGASWRTRAAVVNRRCSMRRPSWCWREQAISTLVLWDYWLPLYATPFTPYCPAGYMFASATVSAQTPAA